MFYLIMPKRITRYTNTILPDTKPDPQHNTISNNIIPKEQNMTELPKDLGYTPPNQHGTGIGFEHSQFKTTPHTQTELPKDLGYTPPNQHGTGMGFEHSQFKTTPNPIPPKLNQVNSSKITQQQYNSVIQQQRIDRAQNISQHKGVTLKPTPKNHNFSSTPKKVLTQQDFFKTVKGNPFGNQVNNDLNFMGEPTSNKKKNKKALEDQWKYYQKIGNF